MGVPDWFVLPERYNDAYQAMGDGVAVPVVEWLSEGLLRPMAEALPEAVAAPAGDSTRYAALAERRASAWLASRQT